MVLLSANGKTLNSKIIWFEQSFGCGGWCHSYYTRVYQNSVVMHYVLLFLVLVLLLHCRCPPLARHKSVYFSLGHCLSALSVLFLVASAFSGRSGWLISEVVTDVEHSSCPPVAKVHWNQVFLICTFHWLRLAGISHSLSMLWNSTWVSWRWLCFSL